MLIQAKEAIGIIKEFGEIKYSVTALEKSKTKLTEVVHSVNDLILKV